MTPLQAALLNLKASPRSPRPSEGEVLRLEIFLKDGELWGRSGGGGEYKMRPLSNGSVQEGDLVLATIDRGEAVFTSMPR
jgi:hypothetical protein